MIPIQPALEMWRRREICGNSQELRLRKLLTIVNAHRRDELKALEGIAC